MTRILITGANSYIGKSFITYMNQFNEYEVDSVLMRNAEWKNIDFSNYDVVFHTAGIAHIKETVDNRKLYFSVNKDLAKAVAKKAKEAGVRQLIFISTMSVYGMDTGVITKETQPNPKNAYGKSKLEAEEELKALEDDRFRVCTLRPPMVYGKDCKGNFQTVIKLVGKFPFFPKVRNQRSMIYIDNLCSFIKMAIDEKLDGLYFPQNIEYMNTTIMAIWIAEAMKKNVHMSKLLGATVRFIFPLVGVVRRAFGNLIYKDTEEFDFKYCSFDSKSSVKESV